MGNYKFKFSLYGLIAVVLIMIPNIIWMIFPPSNDALSGNNSYLLLDIIENISRIAIILLLTFVVNEKGEMKNSKKIKSMAIICLIAYYALWLFYYTEPMQSMDLIAMAVLPVVSLILVAIWQRNYISIIPISMFGVTHIAITCINYS